MVEGQWIFGMVERGSNKCVLVPVPDRTGNTLLRIIKCYVLPGTTIISDGWKVCFSFLTNFNFFILLPSISGLRPLEQRGIYPYKGKSLRQRPSNWSTYKHNRGSLASYEDLPSGIWAPETFFPWVCFAISSLFFN